MITTEKKFLYKPQKLTILNCKIYHIPVFCIGKVLNNIKFEPQNPSKSQIIHKNTYYTTTKYVHINGKVCTHTDMNNTPPKTKVPSWALENTTSIVNNGINRTKKAVGM